jgi:hypothetical protein
MECFMAVKGGAAYDCPPLDYQNTNLRENCTCLGKFICVGATVPNSVGLPLEIRSLPPGLLSQAGNQRSVGNVERFARKTTWNHSFTGTLFAVPCRDSGTTAGAEGNDWQAAAESKSAEAEFAARIAAPASSTSMDFRRRY